MFSRRKDGRHLQLNEKALFLPLTNQKVKKAVWFKGQEPVTFTKTKTGILLEFFGVPKDIDSIVELTLQ